MHTTPTRPATILVRWMMLIALGVMLIGCSESPPGPKSGDAIEQTSEAVESRFVVLSPAIAVMLRDLGFEDSIVGRHSYDSALSDSIPAVGSHLDIDYELLIELGPTDVFFEKLASDIPEPMRTLAEANGWRIWTYELKTLDDIATTLDDLYLKLVGFPDPSKPGAGLIDFEVDPTAKFDIELPSARLARSWSPMGKVATNAGRVLILAGVDPPGAMGPGSFHAQLIERLGITPAIEDGGMWQELDYEDIIELAPDSILIFTPRAPDADDLIGEPEPMSWDELVAKVGKLATLPIPAVQSHRIAIIEHPLGLLPSSSLGQVGDEIAEVIRRWDQAQP